MTERAGLSAVWVAALLGLTAAGCEVGTEPVFSQDGFAVLAERGRLVLQNDSTLMIRYVVIERSTAAVVDLAPPESWPTLAPGRRNTIPHDEITGYHPDATEALVYWAVELEPRSPVVVRLR